MTGITIYLAIYFALVIGALVALAIGGVLAHFPVSGIVLAFGIAVLLGILTFVVWRWTPHTAKG